MQPNPELAILSSVSRFQFREDNILGDSGLILTMISYHDEGFSSNVRMQRR